MGDSAAQNKVASTEGQNVSKDVLSVKCVESCDGSISEVKLLISTLKFYLLIKFNGFLKDVYTAWFC